MYTHIIFILFCFSEKFCADSCVCELCEGSSIKMQFGMDTTCNKLLLMCWISNGFSKIECSRFLSRESAILLTHYREKEIKCVDISFPSRFFSVLFNLLFVTKVEGDGSKMNNNNSFSSCVRFLGLLVATAVRCESAEGLIVLPIPTDWIISGEMKRSITHLKK